MEMKRRGRIKIEGAQTTFLFCLTQKQKQKKKLNQFKKFCTGSKFLYWFKKFCTGSKILYWFRKKLLYQRQKLNYNISVR